MTEPAEQERFQALMEEHKKILYKVCNSYCRSRDDREDLAQEIIIQLWRSFERFDERCRFSTWMYRIAINVCNWQGVICRCAGGLFLAPPDLALSAESSLRRAAERPTPSGFQLRHLGVSDAL